MQVSGDSMAPIVADGASVAYAKSEEEIQQLDGKMVVAWLENQPVVRWFQNCGRFALLRAENPNAVPQQVLVDLEDPKQRPRFRRVLGINSRPIIEFACLPAQVLAETGQHQNLAVADPPGARLADDRLDGGRRVLLGDEDRQLHLGHERRVVLAAQVLMQPVFLPPVPHRLANVPPRMSNGLERGQHRLGPERFDQSDDLHHLASEDDVAPDRVPANPDSVGSSSSSWVDFQWNCRRATA